MFSFVLTVQAFTSNFKNLNSNSIDMQKKPHIETIPLKTGQQMFSWFCTDAIDEPLSRNQVLARQIFRLAFGIILAAMAVAANSSLFTNQTSVNDLNELFFGFYQFITTLFTASAAIAIFLWGPKLASLFRHLGNIYNACKHLISCCIS